MLSRPERQKIGALLTLVLLLAGIAPPASATRVPYRPYPGNPMLRWLQPGVTEEQYVEATVDPLRLADVDGDGLTAQDLTAPAPAPAPAPRGVTNSVEEVVVTSRPRGVTSLEVENLLRLAPAGDGRLTQEELTRLAKRTFAAVDRDHDRRITQAELDLFRSARRDTAADAGVQRNCAMAPAATAERIVLYGLYEGEAVASVAVAGQDRVTTHAYVDIAPGEEPLYLILTSYDPMVWSFRGDTGRVAHVAVVSAAGQWDKPVGGVIGIPGRRVRVLAPDDCVMYFSDAASTAASWSRNTVRRLFGRDPDVVAATYTARSVVLPEGRGERTPRGDEPSAPAGFDPDVWASAVVYSRAGVVQLNPRRVVGPHPEPYEVAPQAFGLAQLTASEAIEKIRGDSYSYRIVRPIARFPADLAGAHAVRFVLARGVPLPAGDPGHSCVMSEETGSFVGRTSEFCGR